MQNSFAYNTNSTSPQRAKRTRPIIIFTPFTWLHIYKAQNNLADA